MRTSEEHPHLQLLDDFYRAFAARDHRTMAAAYADDAQFSDPVFTDLRGDRIGAMWRMLCIRGTDLELTYRDVAADDREGSAHWEARYTFAATKRRVHNVIDARFTLADGKIVRHVDTFSFYRWSRMALGLPGVLLGWSGFLRGQVSRRANAELQKFIDREERDTA